MGDVNLFCEEEDGNTERDMIITQTKMLRICEKNNIQKELESGVLVNHFGTVILPAMRRRKRIM